jgi:hypothetical protein
MKAYHGQGNILAQSLTVEKGVFIPEIEDHTWL